ncbi:bifunctional diaminohydroxyphosphoribosylaminopyrimidine deaminase/5-amino-6-(5-phosphoribosylamino)uracil reductase RibD [Silvibacterium acidisoli]|uniref:bifunctional diaminohydroxyphosphoribosylaminopyrimidine deaminase/5-amino-6-(5-phosphoribosylamino)uracil reductase RibD n=1 Tax=Acidobacteriaceae bacterium ZG23-2 TaxID=2883246 RepID=UPI00406C7578
MSQDRALNPVVFSPDDEQWMRLALQLAQEAFGLASPNPSVGCVLVKNGRIIGRGAHVYDKRDHAEIVALNEAGDAARGSTAYVTLEPCSHTGRTGPCADALIAAGVARVICATKDPNPSVNGQGLGKLEAAGIPTAFGLLEREARALNDGFAHFIQHHRPFVTLKTAMSLDGRIAPAPGKVPAGAPYMLTGEESLAAVQAMRHRSDALITGINTVLADDPLLTDRTGLPRRRKLLRVILDSSLQLRLDSKIVRTASEDVLVFCTAPVPERQHVLEAMGVRVERLDGTGGSRRIDLKKVLERLGSMNITSAMIEAGSQLNTSALGLGLVDKMHIFYAPVFLGETAVPVLGPLEPLRPELLHVNLKPSGPDISFEGYIRDPWAAADSGPS